MPLYEKTSIFTGRKASMEINVTPEQIARWKNSGTCIQEAFPHLTAGEREFLLSGSTPEEWDQLFKEEKDE